MGKLSWAFGRGECDINENSGLTGSERIASTRDLLSIVLRKYDEYIPMECRNKMEDAERELDQKKMLPVTPKAFLMRFESEYKHILHKEIGEWKQLVATSKEVLDVAQQVALRHVDFADFDKSIDKAQPLLERRTRNADHPSQLCKLILTDLRLAMESLERHRKSKAKIFPWW